MRPIAIVQARMGSTRLPGKVLKDMAGKPMLDRVLDRLGLAKSLAGIVVATTTKAADNVVAHEVAKRGNVGVVRGSEDDVLARYALAAREHPAPAYVRVTADCPLLSPSVVDQVVAALPGHDYASNTLEPRTFPRGLDVEAFTADALRVADAENHAPAWREHVTPFIYRHPERFRLAAVSNRPDLSHHRWTVDTPQDFELCRRIWAHFGDRPFDTPEVLGLLQRNPEWSCLNQSVGQKQVPP